MADLYRKKLESERKSLWAACRLKGLAIHTPERQRIAEIDRLRVAEFGSGIRTVFAEAYANSGLVDALEIRANRGEREILVMNCTHAQVQAVLQWQACDDDGQLEDLVVHLVREA